MIDRVCETCRCPFKARNYQVKTGNGRFCSSRCRALGQPRESLEDRLWAQVDRIDDEDSCWPFTGFVNEDGYGMIAVGGGRNEGAHRVAFRLQGGELKPGERVLHKCDNPPCCRGSHLFSGNQADNVADMIAKGRHRAARGEAVGGSKLDENTVKAIRLALANGVGTGELMGLYGVSRGTIYNIRDRKTWAHVN